MAQAVYTPATYVGPAADKAGQLGSAAVGDFYFEDDTGLLYRKSVAGAWIVITSGTVSVNALPAGTNLIGKVGIDQTTPGTTDSVTVKSAAFDVQTSVTRPANTTPYSAGDVVGGAIDLGVLGNSAKPVQIVGIDLEYDVTAIPAGMTTFLLYLYSVTPPSAIADNGAFDVASGDRASLLGNPIPLGGLTDIGSTLLGGVTGLLKQCLLAGTHLFAYLVTVAGWTPAANSEVLRLTIHTQAV